VSWASPPLFRRAGLSPPPYHKKATTTRRKHELNFSLDNDNRVVEADKNTYCKVKIALHDPKRETINNGSGYAFC
jgi:hypothetical protein